MRVLISTTANEPWLVAPSGCLPSDPPGCEDDRGGIFNVNKSRSWEKKGSYDLYNERNLNYSGVGAFGFDTISLGFNNSGAPILTHQIAASFGTLDFFLGTWGIRPGTTNLTDFNDPIPNWILNLKSQGFISSLSWGYTAGCHSVFQG